MIVASEMEDCIAIEMMKNRRVQLGRKERRRSGEIQSRDCVLGRAAMEEKRSACETARGAWRQRSEGQSSR